MKLIMYEYSKCGTCRKALKWLESHGHDVEKIPIIESPPSAEQLAVFAEQSGLELKKMFNTSGQVYRELGLKDRLKEMEEKEMLELLASNGKLIKRPIVTDGQRTTVGFNEEKYDEVWGENA